MNEEHLKICEQGRSQYGRISVSYVMRKSGCTPLEAQDIATEWHELYLQGIEKNLQYGDQKCNHLQQ